MKTERTLYLLYVPGKGFYTGGSRRTSNYNESFTKARIFKGNGYAKTSNGYIRAHNDGLNPIIIPVTMTLDPENLFEAILKGK